MSGRKVLILTGDAGAGHMACSRALQTAFKKKSLDVEVDIVDIFKFSSFGRIFDGFLSIVGSFPFAKFLFNLGFRLVDKSKIISMVGYFLLLRGMYKPTLKLIKKENPDLVVSNNPLTTAVVTECRRALDFNYIVTVTDIGTIARWWASENADLIFSPTERATKELLGFSPNCKILTGYYSLRRVERLSEKEISKKKEEFCKKSSFDLNKPIILITGGGISTIKILKKIRKFIKESGYQFVILTGRDKRLEKRLSEEFKDEKRIFIQPFTDEVLTFFSLADVIIAKPGANTVLEMEKLIKKVIFTDTVGYQEVGNVEYLKKNPNFVYVGKEYSRLAQEVENLLDQKTVFYDGGIKDAEAIFEYILAHCPSRTCSKIKKCEK